MDSTHALAIIRHFAYALQAQACAFLWTTVWISIDKIAPVCYYSRVKQRNHHMQKFTIYREGKIDRSATLAFRIKVHAPVVLQKIDDAFVRLYKI